MKLIIGLGNPGFRYRSTRHNIGFMLVDKLASDFNINVKRRSLGSLCGTGRIAGEEVMLIKPLTYMNLSGNAVLEIKKKKDISHEEMLVIIDDISLLLGKIRLRPNGSSGGHKGLRSIIERLNTDEFPRLRVGIGSKESKGVGDLSNYVLAPFKRSERRILKDLMKRSSMCVETWVREGAETAMSGYNC